MTLRKYQTQTIILLLALLVLALPWIAFAGVIATTVYTIVVGFLGFFVGIAGNMLDFAITGYVIGFGDSFIKGGVGVAVDTLWVAIRDIFNLTFIFGLVFIGLKMILDSDDSGTRRWLIHLILAALLINFSLYITKFIVDFTNILATEIAQSFPLDKSNKLSISYGFMNSLGITSLLDVNAPLGDSPWAYIFGSAILFLVMIFTFGAGAILLLIRYVVLCLYMVFSPLMFLGWVFPQLQGVTSKYWSGFLGRAFFAPIYLLLVYFSYYVVATIYGFTNASGNTPDFKKALASGSANGTIGGSIEGTLMTFFIACIFLIASIVIASKLGADGANAALRIGNSAKDWGRRQAGNMAGGATFGLAARGMRNTVGRGSDMLTRSDRFKQMAASSTLGKYAYKTAQKGAAASFDARQVGGLGKTAGIGTGVAGGYAKSVKDKAAADKKFLEAIKTDVDTKDPKVRAEIEQRAKEIAEAAEAEKQKVMPAMETNLANTTTEREKAARAFEAERERLENTIKTQTVELNGSATLTPAERAQKIQDMEKNKKDLAKQEKDFKENDLKLRTIENQIKDKIGNIEDRIKRADKYATAEVKYANQITYMKKLEKDATFWSRAGSVATGGLGGQQVGASYGAAVAGAGTATAAGLGAFGLMAGAATASAFADRTNQSLAELRKEYGQDGLKKVEKEAKNQKMKELAAAITEGNKPETPAAEPKPDQPA